MTSVRLYGRFVGQASHARVTSGFRSALADLSPTLVPLDDEPDDEAPWPGAGAVHGVFTGPLGLLGRLRVGANHRRRWVMVAPNSDQIPASLIAGLEGNATDVMVPSQWAAAVLRSLTKLPVTVVPHGIDAEFGHLRPGLFSHMRAGYEHGEFHVLHLSSSAGERKGTSVLIEAWHTAMLTKRLPPQAQLHLVLDAIAAASARFHVLDLEEQARVPLNIDIHERLNHEPAMMANVYQCAHLVCQPSRGEAFGLVPLEARAAGVVVAATGCTGHSEHFGADMPGTLLVPTGPLAPIDDAPGARAPSLSAADVVATLERAAAEWPELAAQAQEHAGSVRAEWSWERRLQPWIETIKQEV